MNQAVALKVQPTMLMVNEGSKSKSNRVGDEADALTFLGCGNRKFSLTLALMVGTLKSATFLKLMDWQADIAQQHLHYSGQLTVIVLDNCSVHRSQLSKQQQQRWQHQGLILFFLPPYSPQMNRIEDEWLHLKRDELATRVFEDEVDGCPSDH